MTKKGKILITKENSRLWQQINITVAYLVYVLLYLCDVIIAYTMGRRVKVNFHARC